MQTLSYWLSFVGTQNIAGAFLLFVIKNRKGVLISVPHGNRSNPRFMEIFTTGIKKTPVDITHSGYVQSRDSNNPAAVCYNSSNISH